MAGPAGAAIAGEVWALPTAAIGALLAQVPPPLGFGTVMLEGGPCLGFLAEAAGVAGAPDITHHGGWRAFLAAEATTAFIRAGGGADAPADRPGLGSGRGVPPAHHPGPGATLADPPLPDALDPAPVFRA